MRYFHFANQGLSNLTFPQDQELIESMCYN